MQETSQNQDTINEPKHNDQEVINNHLKGVLFLLLIIGMIGVIGILFFQNQKLSQEIIELKSVSNAGQSQKIIVYDETDSMKSNETNEGISEWKTYVDNVAGFSIRYPSYWTYEVKSPTTEELDVSGNLFIGKINFIGDEGEIEIVFGDGFGGALCGAEESYLENGEMEVVIANEQDISLCKISSTELDIQKSTYFWVGSCSDCVGVEDKSTTYIFNVYSDLTTINDSIISSILKSFTLTDQPGVAEVWEDYSNSRFNLAFKYPVSYTIEENFVPSNNYLEVIFNNDESITFVLSAKDDYLPGDVSYFLDTESIGNKNINGKIWNIYYLPNGYADGGSYSTDPIYALRTEVEDVLYTVTFNNQRDIDSTQEKILSTLEF